MRRLPIALCLLAASCGVSVAYHNPEPGDMYGMDQGMDLPRVRQRLELVKVGMPLQEVFRLLGKPGTVNHNGFTYHELAEDGAKILNSKQGEVQIGTDGKVVTGVDDVPDATQLYGVGGG